MNCTAHATGSLMRGRSDSQIGEASNKGMLARCWEQVYGLCWSRLKTGPPAGTVNAGTYVHGPFRKMLCLQVSSHSPLREAVYPVSARVSPGAGVPALPHVSERDAEKDRRAQDLLLFFSL